MRACSATVREGAERKPHWQAPERARTDSRASPSDSRTSWTRRLAIERHHASHKIRSIGVRGGTCRAPSRRTGMGASAGPLSTLLLAPASRLAGWASGQCPIK
jgi:hypothetical protein